MQISTKGKYAVRAMLDIAQNSNGGPVALGAISKREGISLLFLEQIFQPLRKGNIVNSIRGPHGGYVLARDAGEITIGEIVRLIEPPLYTSSCFSNDGSVDNCRISDSCIGGAIWKQLTEHVDNFLDSITLADLANKSKPEVVYGLRIKSQRILEQARGDKPSPEAKAEELAETAEVA
ncbi:MAG TPA: Rrf2 family transcriptional regulator [Blastocatellia bacterium]|nr:Rrf2 family transcriptional regulator [Blastocatellia bacterium]